MCEISTKCHTKFKKIASCVCVTHFVGLKFGIMEIKEAPSESVMSVQVKPGQIVESSQLIGKALVTALINASDLCGVTILSPN